MKKNLFTLAVAGLTIFNSFAQYNWTKYVNNPVLSGRTNPGFDMVVADPAVIYDNSDSLYKMWYTAAGVIPGDTHARPRIGYAASPDGINWARVGSPILSNGSTYSWDAYGTETCWTIKISDSLYCMYYSGYPYVDSNNNQQRAQIGLATSSDGVNWTKSLNNPILTIDTTSITNRWSSWGLWGPVVLKESSDYKMWYLGVGPDSAGGQMVWGIGYATSTDGISWNRNAEPVIYSDTSSFFKKISDIAVLKIDSTYYIWFSATKQDNDNYETWLAKSNDGITWEIDSLAPVLPKGPAGSWDYFNAFAPSVLQIGNELEMWYHGSSDTSATNLKIGLATANIETLVPTKFNTKTINIFPNPSSSVINFSVSGLSTIQQIEVYDLTGRMLKQISGLNVQEYILQGGGLSPGLYITKIKLNTGFVTKKIILE